MALADHNITVGFSEISDLFTKTEFADISWIIALMLIGLTLLLITREYEKWAILVLPVTIMWGTIDGLKISLVWYMMAAIPYAISTMSLMQLGDKLSFGTITWLKQRAETDKMWKKFEASDFRRQWRKARLGTYTKSGKELKAPKSLSEVRDMMIKDAMPKHRAVPLLKMAKDEYQYVKNIDAKNKKIRELARANIFKALPSVDAAEPYKTKTERKELKQWETLKHLPGVKGLIQRNKTDAAIAKQIKRKDIAAALKQAPKGWIFGQDLKPNQGKRYKTMSVFKGLPKPNTPKATLPPRRPSKKPKSIYFPEETLKRIKRKKKK